MLYILVLYCELIAKSRRTGVLLQTTDFHWFEADIPPDSKQVV